jgi:hypothetical protein
LTELEIIEKNSRIKAPFKSWFFLSIITLIALLSYQQRFSLPFVYSYCGDNEKDTFHALAKSYPEV